MAPSPAGGGNKLLGKFGSRMASGMSRITAIAGTLKLLNKPASLLTFQDKLKLVESLSWLPIMHGVDHPLQRNLACAMHLETVMPDAPLYIGEDGTVEWDENGQATLKKAEATRPAPVPERAPAADSPTPSGRDTPLTPTTLERAGSALSSREPQVEERTVFVLVLSGKLEFVKHGQKHVKKRELTEEEMAIEKRRIFDEIDEDGSGEIEPDEIMDALRDNDVELPREEVDALIADMDPEGHGVITYEMFARSIKLDGTGGGNWFRQLKEERELKVLFQTIDADGSGEVDEDELKDAMASAGVEMTDAQVHELFEQAAGGEDIIGFAQFVDIFHNVFGVDDDENKLSPGQFLGGKAVTLKRPMEHGSLHCDSRAEVLLIDRREYQRVLQAGFDNCLQEKKALLRSMPIFKSMNEENLRLLCLCSFRVEKPRGAKLCQQGYNSDSMYIIMNGECSLVHDMDGITFDSPLDKAAPITTVSQIQDVYKKCGPGLPKFQPHRTNKRHKRKATFEVARLMRGEVCGELAMLEICPNVDAVVTSTAVSMIQVHRHDLYKHMSSNNVGRLREAGIAREAVRREKRAQAIDSIEKASTVPELSREELLALASATKEKKAKRDHLSSSAPDLHAPPVPALNLPDAKNDRSSTGGKTGGARWMSDSIGNQKNARAYSAGRVARSGPQDRDALVASIVTPNRFAKGRFGRLMGEAGGGGPGAPSHSRGDTRASSSAPDSHSRSGSGSQVSMSTNVIVPIPNSKDLARYRASAKNFLPVPAGLYRGPLGISATANVIASQTWVPNMQSIHSSHYVSRHEQQEQAMAAMGSVTNTGKAEPGHVTATPQSWSNPNPPTLSNPYPDLSKRLVEARNNQMMEIELARSKTPRANTMAGIIGGVRTVMDPRKPEPKLASPQGHALQGTAERPAMQGPASPVAALAAQLEAASMGREAAKAAGPAAHGAEARGDRFATLSRPRSVPSTEPTTTASSEPAPVAESPAAGDPEVLQGVVTVYHKEEKSKVRQPRKLRESVVKKQLQMSPRARAEQLKTSLRTTILAAQHITAMYRR